MLIHKAPGAGFSPHSPTSRFRYLAALQWRHCVFWMTHWRTWLFLCYLYGDCARDNEFSNLLCWPVSFSSTQLAYARSRYNCKYAGSYIDIRCRGKRRSSLPVAQDLQGKPDSNEKLAWLYKVMMQGDSWGARLSVTALHNLDLQIGDMQDNTNISGNLIKNQSSLMKKW